VANIAGISGQLHRNTHLSALSRTADTIPRSLSFDPAPLNSLVSSAEPLHEPNEENHHYDIDLMRLSIRAHKGESGEASEEIADNSGQAADCLRNP